MLMLVPYNGRSGFAPIVCSEPNPPDKATLLRMLTRENELRSSDTVKRSFDENRADFAMFDELQRSVCEEFGYSDVNVLRGALSFYPEDLQLREQIFDVAFWFKHNRAEQGSLLVGDNVPDMELLEMSGRATRLSEFYRSQCGFEFGSDHGPPLVLVCGSVT